MIWLSRRNVRHVLVVKFEVEPTPLRRMQEGALR
jgi:hypothetical protein